MSRGIKGALRTNLRDFPEYATQLGVAVSHWAYAEEALTHILMHLLGTDSDRAEIVFYASNSERFRADLIRHLATAYIPKNGIHGDLNKALRRFVELASLRNLYVHGLWKHHGNNRLYVVSTKSGPIDWFGKEHRVTKTALARFAGGIFQCEQDLIAVLGDLRRFYPHLASRNKSPKRVRRRYPKSAPTRLPTLAELKFLLST
jgi:hypothetical protein